MKDARARAGSEVYISAHCQPTSPWLALWLGDSENSPQGSICPVFRLPGLAVLSVCSRVRFFFFRYIELFCNLIFKLHLICTSVRTA